MTEKELLKTKPKFTPPASKPKVESCDHKYVNLENETLVIDKINMDNGFASATIMKISSYFCERCLSEETKSKTHVWDLQKETPMWCKLEAESLRQEVNKKNRYYS